MKVKIKRVIEHEGSENLVNVDFEVYKKDGTLLFAVDGRGFMENADTLQEAKDKFKQSLKNIRDTYIKEKKSKMREAVKSLEGQEFDLSDL